MDLMKLPSEPAHALALCKRAGLSDRETRIFVQKRYDQPRTVIIKKPKTYRELGSEFGLSAEAIRLIDMKAKGKLERFIKSEE